MKIVLLYFFALHGFTERKQFSLLLISKLKKFLFLFLNLTHKLLGIVCFFSQLISSCFVASTYLIFSKKKKKSEKLLDYFRPVTCRRPTELFNEFKSWRSKDFRFAEKEEWLRWWWWKKQGRENENSSTLEIITSKVSFDEVVSPK